MTRSRLRVGLTGLAAVALTVLAVWCLHRGVTTRLSTGDLLVAPVALTRLHGGWLTGAAAAVTAAVLCVADAVAVGFRRKGAGAVGGSAEQDAGPRVTSS